MKGGDGKRPFSIKGFLGLGPRDGSSASTLPSPLIDDSSESVNPLFAGADRNGSITEFHPGGQQAFLDGSLVGSDGRSSFTNFKVEHVAPVEEMQANVIRPPEQKVYSGGLIQQMSVQKILSSLKENDFLKKALDAKPTAETATGPGKTHAPAAGNGQIQSTNREPSI